MIGAFEFLILGTVGAVATTSQYSSGNAESTLEATFHALGGLSAWQRIDSISLDSQSIFRSHTLGQNYDLFAPDQSVASSGSQSLAFMMQNDTLLARLERSYTYDDYWIWAFPDLHPLMNYTVIIRDGPDGYACFNEGQNNFYSENPLEPLGYADPHLTDYLVSRARQLALPWVLRIFVQHTETLAQYYIEYAGSETRLLAVENHDVGLTLLIDPVTFVPFAIRGHEQHSVYGDSTSDILLSAWSAVSFCEENCTESGKILLPHRFQTVYNAQSVLEDFVVDTITINTANKLQFQPSVGLNSSSNSSSGTSSSTKREAAINGPAPSSMEDYLQGDVHEFFESGLWNWPSGEVFDISQVAVQHPFSDLSDIMTIYVGDYPDYVQLLVEHETGLIITDAAPHRSRVVLEWVAKNMNGKRITHVVPSHHHRDHAGGVYDYVAAGATLVVPEIAKTLYNFTGSIPSTLFEAYTDREPFVYKDKKIDFRSYWREEGNPHARDWSFSVATKASPTDSDGFALFNADVVDPGTAATRWDTSVARQFLLDAVALGLPPSTLIVGAHGSTQNGTSTADTMENIARISAFGYPNLTVDDWKKRNW